MFQKARDTAYLESTSLLILMVRWKKPLLIVMAVALAGSVFFSSPLFITPKYKSTVILFPSSTNSVSKAIMEDSPSEKQDILAFGEEEQAEQMLQILNSDDIRNSIIQKYNLREHYEINASSDYPMTLLTEEFKDNITFSRTEFMSVKIEVLDKDPQTAADIANDIAALLDSTKTKIQRTRANEVLSIIEKTYAEKQGELKKLEDSLQSLRAKGIMNYEFQSEILNSAYNNAQNVFTNESAALPVLLQYKDERDTSVISCKARIKGAEAKMKILGQQLHDLAQYGGASMSLKSEIESQRKELTKIKEQLEKALIDANQNVSHKFIVNQAVKAEKKSYPVRWLIVLLTLAATFVLAMVVLSSLQKYKEINI